MTRGDVRDHLRGRCVSSLSCLPLAFPSVLRLHAALDVEHPPSVGPQHTPNPGYSPFAVTSVPDPGAAERISFAVAAREVAKSGTGMRPSAPLVVSMAFRMQHLTMCVLGTAHRLSSHGWEMEDCDRRTWPNIEIY